MMKFFKSLAAGLVLAVISAAPSFGQGLGQLSPGQVAGNPNASQQRAQAASLTAIIDRAFTCSVNGLALNRVSGSWVCSASLALGAPGSSVGSVVFGNATSGTETLQPATGALGSGVASLPAGTYNIAGDSLTQTFTNKTINCSSNTCTVPLSSLGTGSLDQVIGYFGSTTANALAINNCANALTYSTTTHTFGCNSTAGTGTVVSVTPGGGLVSSTTAACSQTAITTSGTLSGAECFDARTTTTETINDSDRAKMLTFSNASATAASIAQAGAASNFQAGWFVDIRNLGAGTVTITPATSTINGQASFKLIQGASGRLSSDGTNYQLEISTAPNTVQAQPSNPAATASTTGVMAGLGASCTLTPVLTGRVKLEINFSIQNSGTGGQNALMKFGTGGAPANGAAVTGTSVGASRNVTVGIAGAPISVTTSGIVTGLTPGTAIWFDVDFFGSANSTTIKDVDCNAFEF